MLRNMLLLLLAFGVPAVAQESRVDELAQLRRTIADQERRIADLERTVKTLQAALIPSPVPLDTPGWEVSTNWNLIRRGVSEAQVMLVLGPPQRVQSVTDMRTLYYPNGSVTLKDDRVTATVPPAASGLRGGVNSPITRVPPTTPLWYQASNWSLIKRGMSEDQVVEILGPATRVRSVTDTRVLDYEPDVHSTVPLVGSVTLKDDRVTSTAPPRF